ncbi:hypothetical protein TrST_g13796 [Triparma strigata]|uniref:Macro domain-containing protein n=1 Tax=Triparma strigata TaxID=1606541 RepID=A0A9W7AMF4_9STRA|nr:hypothetical protein TrST_g13796 [Triparma strigata]
MSVISEIALRSTTFRIVTSSCIVTNPNPSLIPAPPPPTANTTTTTLIVPTNPFLTSTTKFPYFATGGPSQQKFDSPRKQQADWAPPGFVSNWGGMEIGGGMRYSSQTVDGLVYLHGGSSYQQSLQQMREEASTPHILDEGTTNLPPPTLRKYTSCPAPPKLKDSGYDQLVHIAVPPASAPSDHLARVITWAIEGSLTTTASSNAINSPLIGAGCRGWDVESAASAFCSALKSFDSTHTSTENETAINLCVMDPEIADTISALANKSFNE